MISLNLGQPMQLDIRGLKQYEDSHTIEQIASSSDRDSRSTLIANL